MLIYTKAMILRVAEAMADAALKAIGVEDTSFLTLGEKMEIINEEEGFLGGAIYEHIKALEAWQAVHQKVEDDGRGYTDDDRNKIAELVGPRNETREAFKKQLAEVKARRGT